jgi:anti-sigma B factor antagonist
VRLKVDYERSGETGVIVRLSGEVDLSDEEQLVAMVADALGGRPPTVVVDLSGVRFMDCAGIRALLRVQRAARERDCALTVRDPQPTVERILRIVQVAVALGLPPDPW